MHRPGGRLAACAPPRGLRRGLGGTGVWADGAEMGEFVAVGVGLSVCCLLAGRVAVGLGGAHFGVGVGACLGDVRVLLGLRSLPWIVSTGRRW
jgi:hypothetical protein